MNSTSGRLVILSLLITTGLLFWNAFGCSGDSSRETSLEGAFLDYEETELIDFKLSGEAKCQTCDQAEIAGLYIELVSQLSPTTNLSVGTFEGVGNFYFPSLRAVAESKVDVYGTLFFEGKPESQALKAKTTFNVPDDDDETAAVILQFSQ